MGKETNDSANVYSAAPGVCRVVRVLGKDATDFLNRLLSCAVKSLPEPTGNADTAQAPMRWMPGCLLGGDGRIRHEVAVVRSGRTDYLVVPVGPARPLASGEEETLFTALDAFLFTESVELNAMECRVGYGTAMAPAEVGSVLGWAEFLNGTGALDLRGDLIAEGGRDGIRVVPVGSVSLVTDLPEFPVGVPVLGRDYSHQNLPLEAGLKGSISFTKGCFPGQEIMARIENLGHPAKLLVRITGERIAPGQPLFARKADGTSVEVGTVTSEDGGNGLAMVRWDWRSAGTEFIGDDASDGIWSHGPVGKYDWALNGGGASTPGAR